MEFKGNAALFPAIAIAAVFLLTVKATAQLYVCGPPGVDEAGSVQVTEASHYSVAAAGFDLAPAPRIEGGTCSGDSSFFFSAPLPEGSYRIVIEFASIKQSATTVRAESRRWMVGPIITAPGARNVRIFDVNVHTARIADDPNHSVKLKARETGGLNWDEKLTLEFDGQHPSIHSIRIDPVRETTIYLAGDSTVVDQDDEPWAAWGQMLPRFLRPGVVVANYAESGETTRSFVGEQRMAKILSVIQPGDYLFIQFGHNDQKPNAVSLEDYKSLLVGFIAQARGKGANPVLVTSMNRRSFEANGQIKNTLAAYTEAVREIAAQQKTPIIDLNAMSKSLFEALGPEGTKKAFVHYPANTFPDQPKALADDTHFNSYGAYELARCMVHGIRSARLPLVEFLDAEIPDFDGSRPDVPEQFHLPATVVHGKDRPDRP